MSQFDELPEGWDLVSISDIADVTKLAGFEFTKYFNYQEIGEVRVVRGLNVGDGFFKTENFKFIDFETSINLPRSQLKPGDLLITYVGTPGKVALLPNDGITYHLGPNVGKIVISKKIKDARYLLHFIRSPLGKSSIQTISKAVTQSSLSMKQIRSILLPLPPLNEQRRIVEKIEALTDRSRKARAALDQIPALLAQFRQSVLAAAFRGDLTADWRAQNPDVESAEALLERISVSTQNPKQVTQEIGRLVEILPQGWTWTKLKTIIPHIQAGKNFSCPEVPVNDETVGMVKISAVTWGIFNPRETKTVVDKSKIDPSLFIKKGDFLISRANTAELVGASVIVDEIQHKIMLSDKVWRVDFVDEIDKRYINLFLKSDYGRKEIESRATGNQLSMRNISQKLFQDIVIPLPPYKEQKAVADEIERLFHLSEQVKQQRYDTEIDLAQLDQSILAKAFRGELVPQDPTDEPATVLLDRIRAERDSLAGQKKGRQRAKS